jgi:hypothetical protein
VILGHGRWRRRVALLAAGALDADESRSALSHAESCPSCAQDLAHMRSVLALVAADPLRGAEPPIPLGALMARVNARLDEEARPRPVWRPLLGGAGALAAVVLGVLVLRAPHSGAPPLSTAGAPSRAASPPASAAVEAEPLIPADALRRLEHTLERDRAARYLSDAQDVLVTVAAAPQRCTRRRGAVEVGAEAERSRDLLARRQLFVESDGSATAAARDVLDDVEEMLREVAALDPCARPEDLEAIRGEITRRHLLMKIDLVTRELRG